MLRCNIFEWISQMMSRESFVMDTEDLHNQLPEIAASAAIDASADRGEVDRRAGRYRRHRRLVGSAFVALAVVAIAVVLVVLTAGGDSSQSIHVPPAQTSDGT